MKLKKEKFTDIKRCIQNPFKYLKNSVWQKQLTATTIFRKMSILHFQRVPNMPIILAILTDLNQSFLYLVLFLFLFASQGGYLFLFICLFLFFWMQKYINQFGPRLPLTIYMLEEDQHLLYANLKSFKKRHSYHYLLHYNVVWKRFGMIFFNDIGTGEEGRSVLQNWSVYSRMNQAEFMKNIL